MGKITFYFVPETNPPFNHPTVFWPKNQDRDFYNVNGVGEISTQRYKKFFGTKPWMKGDHFCGTLKDHVGEGVLPPVLPLPPEKWCDCEIIPTVPPWRSVHGTMRLGGDTKLTYTKSPG